MRVAIGGLMQETNSFSPVPTTLGDFEAEYLLPGDEIREYFEGTNTEIAGFLNACDSLQNVQVIPLFAAAANSGGNVTVEAFGTLTGELVDRLTRALEEDSIDVLLLALHGSMCVDGEDDPEGSLLASCRSVVGSRCVIGASLDLHANVTDQMAGSADVLVGYRTYPHVDQASTAQRVAAISLHAAMGSPVQTVIRKLPLLLQSEHTQTTEGPMYKLRAEADRIEAEGLAKAVSIFSVQPWLDVPQVGCSVVVVGHDLQESRVHALRLSDELWRRRHQFVVELVDLDQAVRESVDTIGGPIILVDSADCASSGAPGDSAAVLGALVNHVNVGGDLGGMCLLTVCDSEVAGAAHDAGLGGQIDMVVGGRLDPARSKGVCFHGYVDRLTDGKFVRKGHAFTGLPLDAGPTAVLAWGSIRVLVTSRAVPSSDPELFRAAGLEPSNAKIVSIKSPVMFRAAYDEFARRIIYLDTPGAASPNLAAFPWRRISRPIHPLDAMD